MTETTKIFISYARSDNKKISPLLNALENIPDFEILRDTQDILPSEEWKPRLEELVRSADIIIFFLSNNSVASDICSWEIELSQELNKRTIPIVLGNVANAKVPKYISALNYIYFKHNSKIDDVIELVQQTVNTDIDWIREHTRLTEIATRWYRAQRIAAQPLRGHELQAAENWMARQPRTAPPPTELQLKFIIESRRLATRRQRIVTGVSIVSAIVLIGLSSAAWIQRNSAIQAEERAQNSLKSATRAANTMLIDLAGELNGARVPKSTVSSVLEKANKLRLELGNQFGDAPELSVLEGTASLALGDIYTDLGRTDEARNLIGHSISIRRKWLSAKPQDVNRMSMLANALYLHSLVFKETQNLSESKRAVNEALALRRKITTLAPKRHLNLSRMSTLYGELASFALGEEDYTTSRNLREEAIKLLEDYSFKNPEVEIGASIAQHQTKISLLLRELGDLDEAEALINLAEDNARKAVNKDTTRIGRYLTLASALSEKAEILEHTGQSENSFHIRKELMNIRNDLAIRDPQNVGFQSSYATALWEMGRIQQTRGQYAKSRDLIVKAIDIKNGLLNDDPSKLSHLINILSFSSDLVQTHVTLGEIEAAKLRLQDAQRALDRQPLNSSSFVLERTLWGFYNSSLFVASFQNDGAQMLKAIEKMEKVESLGLEREVGSIWWQHARGTRLSAKATALAQINDYKSANLAAADSIKQYLKLEKSEPENITWPINRLNTMVYQAFYQEKIQEISTSMVDELYVDAFNLSDQLTKRDPSRIEPFNSMVLIGYNRGNFYRDYGLFESAYNLFNAALEAFRIREARFPENANSKTDLENILSRLGLSAAEHAETLLKKRNPVQAEKWSKLAIKHSPNISGYVAELGHARMLQGDFAEALKIYQSVDGPIGFGDQSWTQYLTIHLKNLREVGYSDAELIPLIQFLKKSP